MDKKWEIPIVLAGATLITVLFHKQHLGLNLFLLESGLLAWLVISEPSKFRHGYLLPCGIGLLISSVFTILTHSIFCYIIHFLALFLFVGILIYPQAKSLINTMGLSFSNSVKSQVRFAKDLSGLKVNGRNTGSILWKSRIFIIPMILIVVFVVIYSLANPVFNRLLSDVFSSIDEFLNRIFKNFDFSIVGTFIVGLIISNFLILRTSNQKIIQRDLASSDELTRNKRKIYRNFRTVALKNEYKAGIFLLLVLNAILLIVNVIDINWVWFNFKWEGQYLKQFVHEGTYLLILSILISIVLVLFFFRRNLNFYRNNKLLRYMSYLWLAQNAVLTISVAIRNLYYIRYFSLAYRRIGVIIFLILTLYGLFTVFMKVRNRKSTFYLFRTNAFALYIVLIISSIINWDTMIAKYNFNHAYSSFLHLDFMAALSDKSLPYLDKPMDELSEIDKFQKQKFPYEVKYMSPEIYYMVIQQRKKSFVAKWESKNFLEWNLPEYSAYRKLKGGASR
jgi:hypothetical protein